MTYKQRIESLWRWLFNLSDVFYFLTQMTSIVLSAWVAVCSSVGVIVLLCCVNILAMIWASFRLELVKDCQMEMDRIQLENKTLVNQVNQKSLVIRKFCNEARNIARLQLMGLANCLDLGGNDVVSLYLRRGDAFELHSIYDRREECLQSAAENLIMFLIGFQGEDPVLCTLEEVNTDCRSRRMLDADPVFLDVQHSEDDPRKQGDSQTL